VKRFLAFILVFIYSVTTIGATVQLHYCMGKFAGWSLAWTETKSKECDKCGMEKSDNPDKGCCKDDHKLLKIQDDQKANYISLEILKLSTATPVVADNQWSFSLPVRMKLLPDNNAPPRNSFDLCVRNCVFRI
jgi:hypothetical protein